MYLLGFRSWTRLFHSLRRTPLALPTTVIIKINKHDHSPHQNFLAILLYSSSILHIIHYWFRLHFRYLCISYFSIKLALILITILRTSLQVICSLILEKHLATHTLVSSSSITSSSSLIIFFLVCHFLHSKKTRHV